ncbi:hypothetical protein HKCCSP123_13810 [Rhodobacterales bacterium HKCCSP123]|nr:hypothetical protein [Rhodobacterales bacterium HKCCSP123]
MAHKGLERIMRLLLQQVLLGRIVAFLAFFTISDKALALQITVDTGGGPTTYDILFFDDSETFTQNQTVLTTPSCTVGQPCAPWWSGGSNDTLANLFASAYFDTHGVTNAPFTEPGNQRLLFAYGPIGASVLVEPVDEAIPGVNTDPATAQRDQSLYFFAYAVVVPEINAPTFLKAIFCLFAFGCFLVASRKRIENKSSVQPI